MNLTTPAWLLALIVQLLSLPALAQTEPDAALPPHLLRPFGLTVTEGAAPGYIEDRACAICHRERWDSYQDVGMSKSFSKPSATVFIEDFDAAPFFHAPSQRYYAIVRKGDDLLFRRYQRDEQGNPINVFERKVDWIMGSGHKTRSYLYQTEAGELYQFPIGWYSETRQWRMAPGYDHENHEGIERRVRRECMFCHNAYPDVPSGSDTHWQPHLFPADLPQGTGCQRCHGPGAKHVRAVLGGQASSEEIRGAIVNPARLPVEKRDSVCFQCHLLPAVELIGVRRFDRPDYSFRPGESLNDYLLHVDMDEPGKTRSERFEINHHGYRLRQSPCFQASSGALTCITCHDPHRKVPPAERATHYGSVCLGCHEAHSIEPAEEPVNAADCVSCHMPQRRTQDVIHVVMTDHRIGVYPNRAELLAPLEEDTHTISDVEFLMPSKSPAGTLGEIYRVVTMLRALVTPELVDRLASLLEAAPPEDLTPYFDLAKGQIKLQRFDQARATIRLLLEKQPNHYLALQWMGIVRMSLGELESAERMFRASLEQRPESAEVHFNLALLLLKREKSEEAAAELRRSLDLRPEMAVAWYYLALISENRGEIETAIDQYRRALSLDPSHARSYVALAGVLLRNGHEAEAARYLQHGLRVATDTEEIAKALAEIHPAEE